MIVVSFETKKDQEKILDEAIKYFRDKVGLEVTEQGPCCVYFGDRNKLGYINVKLTQEGEKFRVDVESREYEYHAKKFTRALK